MDMIAWIINDLLNETIRSPKSQGPKKFKEE